MESHIRAPRPLVGLVLATSALALAACGGAGATPTGAAPSVAASAAASPAASPAASTAPTAVAATDIDKLPEASLDPSKIAVACDQAALGTSASMSCDEIVNVAARVAPLDSNQPIQQVAVKQSTATAGGFDVTFWTLPDEGSSGLQAFTFTIDPVNKTFTFPVADPEAVFPTAS